jgi:hypothetical protein
MDNAAVLAIVLVYGAISYMITGAPGILVLWYLRRLCRKGRAVPPILAGVVAALFVAPAFVVAAHNPLIVPFALSMVVQNQFVPNPIPANIAVAVAAFAIAVWRFRRANNGRV